ncbi:unnamed protein product [Protopolystoma xenopodis]|uniref:Uncharacterized protein n=1 Tax=Protopolystoma xenopodis TaxID=117903 RepID=A0A448WDL9_9PLAT|nr:unnamed protein product [Protopolystoma xenopodis]
MVLSGRYEGETGLVIRFEPSLAIVLSDQGMSELKVAPKDLRLWQDTATSCSEAVGHVQLMDLVQVDPQTVGVVTRVNKDQIMVLTAFGKLMSIKANTALRRLNMGRRAPPQAMDRNGNLITLKQTVRLLEKPHSGLTGEVKHLYRSWAFVYCPNQLENSGMVAVKTRQLAVLGVSAQNSLPSDTGGFAVPGPQTITQLGPLVGSRFSGGGGGFGRGGRGGARREKSIIGRSARIIAVCISIIF